MTVTSTVPEPLGLMAVSSVLETNVGATRVVPKATVLSLVKLLPAIVTCVPPAAGPTSGRSRLRSAPPAWASAGHAPTNRTANAARRAPASPTVRAGGSEISGSRGSRPQW